MSPTLPILPSGVLESGVLRIDSSGFSEVLSCYRKAWHKLCLRRTTVEERPELLFGGALHAAMHERQQWWGAGPFDCKRSLLAQTLGVRPELMPVDGQITCQQAMELAIDRHFEGKTLPLEEHRNPGRAKEVMGLYNQLYPKESFEVLASERSEEREMGHVVVGLPCKRCKGEGHVYSPSCVRANVTFMSDCLDCHHGKVATRIQVLWQGRTDGIWRQEGKCYIKDLKHSTELGDADRKRQEFKMSWQMPLYCWLFSGPEFGEIRDVVVDFVAVRKPLLRPTAKSAPRNEFHRWTFSYTDQEIEERKRDVLRILEQWLTLCASPTAPPPMTGAPLECTWARAGCPFLSVCEQSKEEDRMRWLESGNFRDYTWDPMKGE